MLTMIHNRLPKFREVVPVFSTIVVLVYSWMIFIFLRDFPSWALFLDKWNITLVFIYGCAWALVESIAVLMFLLFWAIVLPGRWLRERFSGLGNGFILILAPWLIMTRLLLIPIYRFPDWVYQLFFLLALTMVIGLNLIAYRAERFGTVLAAFAERLSIFLYIYLPLGIFSVIIVLLRNLI